MNSTCNDIISNDLKSTKKRWYEDLKRTQQRVLLGCVRNIIHGSIDLCKHDMNMIQINQPKGAGCNKDYKEACTNIHKIHEALIPWIHIMWRLSSDKLGNKIKEIGDKKRVCNVPEEGEHIIYVIFNMMDGDYYIGRTNNFKRKRNEHFGNIIKHPEWRINICKKCKEHQK